MTSMNTITNLKVVALESLMLSMSIKRLNDNFKKLMRDTTDKISGIELKDFDLYYDNIYNKNHIEFKCTVALLDESKRYTTIRAVNDALGHDFSYNDAYIYGGRTILVFKIFPTDLYRHITKCQGELDII